MIQIDHLTQPTPDSCTSTCLAMLLKQPIKKILMEFHDSYRENNTTPGSYLGSYYMRYGERLTDDTRLYFGWIYLLSVPSLNRPGELHHIIADARENEEIWIYDPARGYEGRRYYSWIGDYKVDHGGEEIKAWCISLALHAADFEEWHRRRMLPNECPKCGSHQLSHKWEGNTYLMECFSCGNIELAVEEDKNTCPECGCSDFETRIRGCSQFDTCDQCGWETQKEIPRD